MPYQVPLFHFPYIQDCHLAKTILLMCAVRKKLMTGEFIILNPEVMQNILFPVMTHTIHTESLHRQPKLTLLFSLPPANGKMPGGRAGGYERMRIKK